MERRPSSLARSFVHGSTHHFRKERGAKRLAQGVLGPWALAVGLLSPRAPETVQVERRLVWRTIVCPPKDQPRSLLRLLEQGPESQSASSVCWGGVSSVMGSSDLAAHSFVPSRHKVISIKAHCLEGLNNRLLVWRACASREAGSWSRVDPWASDLIRPRSGFRCSLMPVLPP